MNLFKLRKACIDDLEMLERWDRKDHIIAADPNDDWDWKNELNNKKEWREQFIAELNGRPIGFIQIIDPEKEASHYWGKVDSDLCAIDIWIGEATDLNKGYGTEMMHLTLDRCFFHHHARGVLIDPLASNRAAIRFYKRLGFQFLGKRVFGKDTCEVYFVKRETWAEITRTNTEKPTL